MQVRTSPESLNSETTLNIAPMLLIYDLKTKIRYEISIAILNHDIPRPHSGSASVKSLLKVSSCRLPRSE